MYRYHVSFIICCFKNGVIFWSDVTLLIIWLCLWHNSAWLASGAQKSAVGLVRLEKCSSHLYVMRWKPETVQWERRSSQLEKVKKQRLCHRNVTFKNEQLFHFECSRSWCWTGFKSAICEFAEFHSWVVKYLKTRELDSTIMRATSHIAP